MSKLRWFTLSVTVLGLLAALIAFASAPAMAATPPTVQVRQDPTYGNILVDSKGMTLYQFSLEKNGKARCFGFCVKYWPPLTVSAGAKPVGGPGVTGKLGTFERSDGTLQVTYNNQPLYRDVKDARPGDTVGQGHNNHFFVVPVSGPAPTAAPGQAASGETSTGLGTGAATTTQEPTILADQNPKLGIILVNAEGMTLYTYSNDKPGESTCTSADCTRSRPPFTVEQDVQPTADQGIPGKVDVIQRKDGTNQVTYNDQPLYLSTKDAKPGDAKGETAKEWLAVKIAEPTVTMDQDPKLGDILVDAKGMTLYTFGKDKPNESTCTTADCIKNWPPLTVDKGVQPVADQSVPGKLDVITRKGGVYQVTYDGQPLYLYSRDAKPGDTTGQSVANWAVAQAIATKAEAGQPATVALIKDAKLGNILVDANGRTLYVYSKDKIGQSNCTGNCAKAWPPLAVAKGVAPVAGPGINAKVDVLARKDGLYQVTFNGVPLYLNAQDTKPGDAKGQGAKDWFAAQIK